MTLQNLPQFPSEIASRISTNPPEPMGSAHSKTTSPLPLPWLIGQVLAIVGLAATLGWRAAYESSRIDETQRDVRALDSRTGRDGDTLHELERKVDVVVEIVKRIEGRMDREDSRR